MGKAGTQQVLARGKSVLSLVTDAFGGHGGIALYNRDFLEAICAHTCISNVTVFPRLVGRDLERLPPKLDFITSTLGGKFRYIVGVLRYALARPQVDLLVCAHLNLLPLAFLLRAWFRAPILLQIYGCEAWEPTNSWIVNVLARRADLVVSISEVTKQRFMAWSGVKDGKISILANAIHLDRYGPVLEKNGKLLDRYSLEGRVVLMTLGRIAAEERYKGFDEVLNILTHLSEEIPNISYLIVGSGSDVDRLIEKARNLGLSERVVFAGLVAEAEKAEHFRLADVFVMPSYGEGFGFVFLEAMACGIPVIGSKTDGSREALRDGQLGELVDPKNPLEIISAVKNALTRPRVVPKGLVYFSYDNFQHRLHKLIDSVFTPKEKTIRQK
jgi:phosphatidylinositol alpha-1,6-mannosyltransferase